ncbi:MAG: hypothetical protein FWG34_13180 [Oscillospiraceae bacterium]|nr:hypothetical protein [Oscillospiraceae bacterium]
MIGISNRELVGVVILALTIIMNFVVYKFVFPHTRKRWIGLNADKKFDDSYVLVEWLKSRFGETSKPVFDDKKSKRKMVKIYKSAAKSKDKKIFLYSGELYPFAQDKKFAKRVIDILKKSEMETTIVCGDVIACDKDAKDELLPNPLLDAADKGHIKADVYHNSFTADEQKNRMYFHSVISGDGKRIMVEIPHDHDAHNNPEKLKELYQLYFNNCKNVYDFIKPLFEKYTKDNGLQKISEGEFDKAKWKCRYYENLAGDSVNS